MRSNVLCDKILWQQQIFLKRLRLNQCEKGKYFGLIQNTYFFLSLGKKIEDTFQQIKLKGYQIASPMTMFYKFSAL